MSMMINPYWYAAAVTSDIWRLSFPDGGPSTDTTLVNAREVEMFAVGDEDGTDLCSGGTASASTEFISLVAANAFDNNTTTAWQTDTAGGVGSWLQYDFGAPQSIGSFSYTPNSRPGQTVVLQTWDGVSATDVMQYDFSTATNPEDDNQRFLFREDGYIQQAWENNTATTASGGAQATKGNIYTAAADLIIDEVQFRIQPSGAETYAVYLAILNTSNVIQSIVGPIDDQAVSTTGFYTFTPSSPFLVSSGQRFAVMLTRTDGTASSVCRVSRSSGEKSNGRMTQVDAIAWADNTPSNGETVGILNGFADRSIITTRFGLVP